MKKRYTYDHGLPFSEKLGENCKSLIKRVNGNKAAMILFDGMVGEGKTTAMVHVADYINHCYGLPDIDLQLKNHPQLALGGVEFLKQLRVCFDKKLPVIIYDEAGDFNKRGSLSKFNAMMNRTFETFRAFKIIVLVGLPAFHVLDNDLLDKGIPRLLMHLSGRNDYYGNFQGYSLSRMMYLKYVMGKCVVKPQVYSRVEANFVGHFLDLTPERSAALDNISTKGKLEVLRSSEIKADGLMGYGEMANKLGRSIDWLRRAIARLNVKPKRTIGRAKYFDEMALNRVADHLEHDYKNRGKK